ncbi:MAG: hypothetical protein GY906_38715 [bacterium]|nr:hypothetical protein [bacterium]
MSEENQFPGTDEFGAERRELRRQLDEAIAKLELHAPDHDRFRDVPLPEPYVDTAAEKMTRHSVTVVRESVQVFNVTVGEYRTDLQTGERRAFQLGQFQVYVENAERLRNILAAYWENQLRHQYGSIKRENAWFAVELLTVLMEQSEATPLTDPGVGLTDG